MPSTDDRSVSILWINHFAVPPDEGGGTRHFELGRELVRQGWRVTVAASDFNLHRRSYTRRAGQERREPVREQVDGVDLLWLWAAPYQENDWRRMWNWLTFARSVTRWRPAGTVPAVVIGSSPHLFAALAGARVATAFAVPFVMEVRDLWPESMLAAGGRKGAVYYAFAALARYLYRRADRIIVLARGSADHLIRLGIDRRKIVYVPNGVDVTAFSGIARPPRVHDDAFIVVYAGAHGAANALDVVLDAAELLRGAPGIRFSLVGDGPAKPALQASAAARGLTNVEFREPVPKKAMPALLAAADAGLMVLRESPLFAYGVSPNKLFDYLAAALPVVCNVPGEVAEMLRISGAGEQARDGSAAALADAVTAMACRSRQDRERQGRAGQAWVALEHGRPMLAARLHGMIGALVGA